MIAIDFSDATVIPYDSGAAPPPHYTPYYMDGGGGIASGPPGSPASTFGHSYFDKFNNQNKQYDSRIKTKKIRIEVRKDNIKITANIINRKPFSAKLTNSSARAKVGASHTIGAT